MRHFLPALEGRSATKASAIATAVPVLATAENVPIILRGIRTVRVFNTVTVKSRVDGNIVKVGFIEGQYGTVSSRSQAAVG
jgi:membrane fusion protein, multidrug efflux system